MGKPTSKPQMMRMISFSALLMRRPIIHGLNHAQSSRRGID
jgi:hypothetical protein